MIFFILTLTLALCLSSLFFLSPVPPPRNGIHYLRGR
jgi:hypothetical protein